MWVERRFDRLVLLGQQRFYESRENPTRLARVRGLSFVDALLCPHHDVEKHRRPSLKLMMKKHKGVAIALDECCAVAVQDDTYRVRC